MTKYPIYLGCTAIRHKQIGIDAVINARGGAPELNDMEQDEIELHRDARAIKAWQSHRVR